MARHAQITENKFAITLQYFINEVSDEVDFLHADKYENMLQINTMILTGMIKYSQSSQNSKCTISLQYLKKEVRDEVDFLHADKYQTSLQGDFHTLGIKVSYKVILPLFMGMTKDSQEYLK